MEQRADSVVLKRCNGGACWQLFYQEQQVAELAPWEAARAIKGLLAGELAAVADVTKRTERNRRR